MESYENYTPSTIHIQTKGELFTFQSKGIATIREVYHESMGQHGGIEIVKMINRENIVGLPVPKEGVKLIVTMDIAASNEDSPCPRTDLVHTSHDMEIGEIDNIPVYSGFVILGVRTHSPIDIVHCIHDRYIWNTNLL